MAHFVGTSGDDFIMGTKRTDYFDLSQGGDDTAHGRRGDDFFNMGAAFSRRDHITGGYGFDTIVLDGDYSAGLRYSADQYKSIEQISIEAGHDYLIRPTSLGPSWDDQLFLSHLGDGDHLVLNARHMGGDGRLRYEGGGGHETIFGTAQNDLIILDGGLAADDRIDLGGGRDSISLGGDYSFGLVLTNQTVRNVESIGLRPGYSYDLTLAHATVGADRFSINGFLLGPGQTMKVDASASLNAIFLGGGHASDTLIGGHGADQIYGGTHGHDRMTGGGGADSLEGGHGGDRFIYQDTSDSTPDATDLIWDIDEWDTINLKHIDADTTTLGDQAFHLAAALDGHAGELVLTYDATSRLTSIMGDVDGDGQADLVIHASGDHTDFTHFVL